MTYRANVSQSNRTVWNHVTEFLSQANTAEHNTTGVRVFWYKISVSSVKNCDSLQSIVGIYVLTTIFGFYPKTMSGQGPQPAHKVRRNGSPSQRQGPIKAVKPFGINLRNSPSKSPSSPSHTLFTQQGQRRSPVADNRHSPDRRSPGPSSPCPKGKRTNCHTLGNLP